MSGGLEAGIQKAHLLKQCSEGRMLRAGLMESQAGSDGLCMVVGEVLLSPAFSDASIEHQYPVMLYINR